MPSRRPFGGRWRLRIDASLSTAVLVLLLTGAASELLGQDNSGAFYRIFLTDGTTLTSYGDFAKVGDRVVFSMLMLISSVIDLNVRA